MILTSRIKNPMTILLLLVMILLSGEALAQDKKKRTAIDFEDQLVEGQARKPELFYLLQQRQFNFRRLIQLREDFLPEMDRTAEGVQRRGK
jgi:hypothetical protein